MRYSDYDHLLGENVIVQHPTMPDTRWEGRAVGIAMHPTITIEREDGTQVSRPLSWVRISPGR